MLWTNRGKFLLLDWVFHAQAMPTNFYVALVTAAIAPTVDTNTLGELTEIAVGNGYATGGYQLTPGATDFDTMTEDDTGDKAFVQVKDIVWPAAGGPIPDSGDGARYAILTDDNGTVANRQVIAAWDLVTNRSCTDTHSITLEDCELQAIKP
ncbi:MAG TPA: hypothetical protein VMY06_14860 [Sedimentisphaerales bacterium]|nr:hypothetical protein [Sedimentisphaerales bacterium]HUU15579.1 hypothetical protein [Sedimentisphaerales bacterium]